MNTNRSILDKIISVLRESLYLPTATMTADTDLIRDLGFDSLDLISAQIDLEEAFRLELPDDAMIRFRTIGQIADYLRRYVDDGEKTVFSSYGISRFAHA
jgi:acyl carrier protein